MITSSGGRRRRDDLVARFHIGVSDFEFVYY